MARLLAESRWVRRLPAYFIGYGALKERPPEAAVRRTRPDTETVG
jgi:hypothetical protein